jgi:sulfur carrier protein
MQIWVNGIEKSLPDALTIRQLLNLLELPPGPVAVEVNRDVVPRVRHDQHILVEGDRIEVVTLVGGG